MFSITNSAIEYIKSASVGVNEPENACFRLLLGQKGPDLSLDQIQPGDRTVEHEGEVILTYEPAIENQLAGRTLDYDEGKSRLVLTQSD
jgi:hypothetical protein